MNKWPKFEPDPLYAFGDLLWQLVVCYMALYRCDMCGQLAYRGAHHMVGRRKLFFRFKPEYGFCCCGMCHRKIHDKGDVWFIDWLDQLDHERAELYRNHWQLENNTTREVIRNDIGKLEAYCRENGLYPANENRTVLDPDSPEYLD